MVVGVARGADQLTERPDALSIARLYDQVELALERSFPRGRDLWVRGEIQHVADQHDRRGHCYFDLVDPESAGERQAPVLRVKCWQSTWRPLRATLRRAGIELQPGMVVFLRGTLDFYRAKAELGFVLAELDVAALLGRLAAERAELVRALESEGLLRRNAAVPEPPVPLRVGLVASPGTEGYRDFLGQLESSGFGFHVRMVPVTVQGPGAARAIATAVRRMSATGQLDVVVVVRGGGSKADLSVFDAEPVARAIATCQVPVWTGIGHTGDESVADIVAAAACVTPTDCGRRLVERVRSWWEDRLLAAATLARCATDFVAASIDAHIATRERLCAMARHLVERDIVRLAREAEGLVRCAPTAVAGSSQSLRARGGRLAPLALGHLDHAEDRLEGRRRLVAAYDVDRQLERGYTLTLDEEGRVVRSVTSLREGAELTTRFADGTASSTVSAVRAKEAVEVR